MITALVTAAGAGSALTPATQWCLQLAEPPQCFPLAFTLSGEHGRGVCQHKWCACLRVCSRVRVRVSAISLVSFNHHHTYLCVQAIPALVLFVGAVTLGVAPGGGICPSRRQQLPAPGSRCHLGTFSSLQSPGSEPVSGSSRVLMARGW